MEKNITVSFQTTPETSDALEKIARADGQSVSDVVESILNHYLKGNRECKGIHQDRRCMDRRAVRLPAFVGDPRWQRKEFEACSVLDISFGGIRLTVPKRTKIENESDSKEIRVIFTLAECPRPIHLKCLPRWISATDDEVMIGAELVEPDFYTLTTIQKHLI